MEEKCVTQEHISNLHRNTLIRPAGKIEVKWNFPCVGWVVFFLAALLNHGIGNEQWNHSAMQLASLFLCNWLARIIAEYPA